MPLVEYVPDPRRYEDIFSNQVGYGAIVRYRGQYQNGSGFFPQILKNIFAKIANFARPILRAAAPHARAAIEAAQPHLNETATGFIQETTSKLSDAVTHKLTPQEGSGVRKKKRYAKPSAAVKRIRRIPPLNIPDFI